MNTSLTKIDLAAARVRTRWTMALSVGLHALLLLWFILAPRETTEAAPLTEITLLEPGDMSPASSSAPAAARMSSPGVQSESSQEEHFRRESRRADEAPDPQSDFALSDQINARLATLQGRSAEAAGVSAPAPTSLWGSTPAKVAGPGGGGSSPVVLHRGGAGDGPPLELTRGGTGTAPSLTAATATTRRPEMDEPAKGGDSAARRTLAGASLAGPIADRPVVAAVTPTYPDWAKREAVEGSVTLYFVVRPDGSVKENVLVQRTAGFEDFDENARVALKAWRFAALPAGRTGEQWGTITFHFRLRESG